MLHEGRCCDLLTLTLTLIKTLVRSVAVSLLSHMSLDGAGLRRHIPNPTYALIEVLSLLAKVHQEGAGLTPRSHDVDTDLGG